MQRRSTRKCWWLPSTSGKGSVHTAGRADPITLPRSPALSYTAAVDGHVGGMAHALQAPPDVVFAVYVCDVRVRVVPVAERLLPLTSRFCRARDCMGCNGRGCHTAGVCVLRVTVI
jgi:hypothetical protein